MWKNGNWKKQLRNTEVRAAVPVQLWEGKKIEGTAERRSGGSLFRNILLQRMAAIYRATGKQSHNSVKPWYLGTRNNRRNNRYSSKLCKYFKCRCQQCPGEEKQSHQQVHESCKHQEQRETMQFNVVTRSSRTTIERKQKGVFIRKWPHFSSGCEHLVCWNWC